MKKPEPLFKKLDCLQIPVPSLDEGLALYRDKLGHDLIWQDETAAGLRMPGTDAEIVLQTERRDLEVNLLVVSADEAALRFIEAGGEVLIPPFDIKIGRCVVVQDLWGNRLVLLDMSRGLLTTDADKNVVEKDA